MARCQAELFQWTKGWLVVHFGVSSFFPNFLPSRLAISILSDKAVFKHWVVNRCLSKGWVSRWRSCIVV